MTRRAETKMQRLVVGPETVRMLELGHPWVLADRFTKAWPQVACGSLGALVDAQGRFLATALLDPADRVVARVLDSQPIRFDRPWLAGRVRRALQLREQHADLAGSDAYRLINAEGDGLPGLTVDRYGNHLLIQLYTEAWRPQLPQLAAILEEELQPAGIYEKFRPAQTRALAGKGRTFGRRLAGAAVAGKLRVQENGLAFLVDLEEGLNSGLFLDQRRNRRDLMQRVAGRRVLNLFAYTGAFSVAAAAAGAARVTSVDAAAGYLDWARQNFRANGLDPGRHDFITGDCFAELAAMKRNGARFDLVLMDPPSFSTTSNSRFTTRQGTAELVTAALAVLEPGGLLISSSNHQKIDLADYLKELRRGALKAQVELRVLQTLGQPEDFPYPVTFPEGRYLKYVICVRD